MKKTWLSYPLWLLYTVVTGVFAAAYLSWIGAYAGEWSRYLTAAVIGLVFCGIVGVWFAGHWLVCRIKQRKGNKRPGNMREVILLLCLCVTAVLWRLYLMFLFMGNIEGGIFYEMASVKAGGGVPWTTHGASYIYTIFLSFVLSFTGNKVAAGVGLQLVLQVTAMLFFYFAVKFLTGRAEAMCVLAVMIFAPDFCNGMFSLTPETLYFLLYVFGLLLCGLYVKMLRSMDGAENRLENGAGNGIENSVENGVGNGVENSVENGVGNGVKNSAGNAKRYIFTVIIGLHIGCIGFLDVAGWTLLLPMACICVQRKMENKEKTADLLMQMVVCVIASVAAAFLFLGMDAVRAGCTYGEALSAWLAYPVQNFLLPESVFSILEMDLFLFSWKNLLICLCGMFAIIGFWFQQTQKQDIWIIMLILLLVFQVFNFGGMNYKIFFMAVWGILAGIGICTMGGRKESTLAEIDGVLTEEERVPIESGSGRREDENVSMDEKGSRKEEEKPVASNGTAEESDKEKPKVKFIENPLPLPKKHVKREMTYAKEVEGDEMDFDIQVKDDDDFDI